MPEEKKVPTKASALERWGSSWAMNVERWMPDPFIFALVLVFIVIAVAMPVQRMGPYALTQCFYKGFWSFLAFAMQMVIILMTGYAIAYHPAVHRAIINMCEWPKSGKQAILIIVAVTTILNWVNWGLGMIFGALFVLEMGKQCYRRNVKLDFPMAVASAYALPTFLWHWGLSGSAPLLMTVAGHPFEQLFGVVPINQTSLSSYAIGLSVLMFAAAIAMAYFFHPKPELSRGMERYWTPEAIKEKVEEKKPEVITLADKLENNRWFAIFMVAIMVGSIWGWFSSTGFMAGLNLNSINFVFVLIGLALYRNPIAYARVIYRSASVMGGIMLQFPFYAGIQGIMMHSGLGATVAGWLTRIATPFTFPVIAWLVAGIVNIFIPSGGGEWLTIGQSVGTAALNLNVPIGKAILAYGAGDAWTNLVNPFWFLPIMAITRMRVRDFFGWSLAFAVFAIIPYVLGLLFIPY